MRESLFINLLEKYMPNLANIIEKINGKRNPNLTYWHETMLRKVFSPTQTYDSSYYNNSRVSAAWVDINSPLPLMKRDSIAVKSNKLPIFGMSLSINESQLNDLQIMQAQGSLTSQIVARLLDDAVKCTNGMRERMEFLFLQGLSEGGCAIPSEEGALMDNPKNLRLDYGYLPENKYGVEFKWDDPVNAKPLSDFENVTDKADGKIAYAFMSKAAFNLMRKTDEFKKFVANYNGVLVAQNQEVPVPTVQAAIDAVKNEYNIEIRVVDRKVVVEHNGKRETLEPFNRNKVVFTTTTDLGALVYGNLPEKTHRVAGVQYSEPLSYALLSKFSETNPLRETTNIKGIVAPIIENVDEIWVMDITDAQNATDASDTDTNVSLYGEAYAKSAVVAALASVGVTVSATATDKTIQKAINKLNDADEAKFKEALQG